MSESAIQTTPKPPEPALGALEPLLQKPAVHIERSAGYWIRYGGREVLQVAASLRITVTLFTLAILLIFFGTLALVDQGMWVVIHKYFRCFFAFIPLKIFFPRDMRQVPGGFPFPGGWAIAGLLLINLLAAHAVRFRLTWKRSGVMILHAGLIIMIAGEFITGLFAVENRMTIVTGRSADFVYNIESAELVFVTAREDGTQHVVSVPSSLLRKQSHIRYDALPFDIEVVQFLPNSDPPHTMMNDEVNPATAGLGLYRTTSAKPEQNGTDSEGRGDIPSAYIILRERETGKALGTFLFSEWFNAAGREPQVVHCGGTDYEAELRFKRTYRPYTVTLHSVKTEYYPGTHTERSPGTPRSYTSRIQLVDPTHNVDRDVTITMNEPLRYDGETFYQAGVPDENITTVLQVVRNPGWQLPYISCATVALGMLIHFGIQLVGFLRRRAAA